MKKRVGCVFMSMLLFFGIAVMGVYAAGKKQDFTPKTITVKKSYTSSTEKYLKENTESICESKWQAGKSKVREVCI